MSWVRSGHALFAVLGAVALLAPAGAAGEVTITTSPATPFVFSFPRDRTITYWLLIKSGPSEERFALRLTPPRFGTRGGLDEGQSLDGPRALTLSNGGVLGPEVGQPAVIEPCAGGSDRFHGYATGPVSFDVLIPPDTTSMFAVRYNAPAFAPWPDTDLRLRIEALPRLVGDYEPGSPFFGKTATLKHTMHIARTEPRRAGATGVHILLRTSPAAPIGGGAAARRVQRGHSIAIRGRTVPPVPRDRIVLRMVGTKGTSRVSVRADGHGDFRYAWRPRRTGRYELWASYPKQRAGLVADTTSCPRVFDVR